MEQFSHFGVKGMKWGVRKKLVEARDLSDRRSAIRKQQKERYKAIKKSDSYYRKKLQYKYDSKLENYKIPTDLKNQAKKKLLSKTVDIGINMGELYIRKKSKTANELAKGYSNYVRNKNR